MDAVGQPPLGDFKVQLPSPLEELSDERLTRSAVRLLLKRDDLINPEIPGNKWRKLKLNLDEIIRSGHKTLLTFGGAYSNHVRAVAAAGAYLGISTIGVIRGEEHRPLNPSLAYAARRGMRLTYMDRTTYRAKHTPDVIEELRKQWGDFYLLPEGGSNELAVRGCAELPGEIETRFDVICCPCGTGGTLAGVAAGLKADQRALGFSALKGGAFLNDDVRALQERTYGQASKNWKIEDSFHFGGFARKTPELESFIDDFRGRHGLQLDWVYVAKMMYGICALVDRGAFDAGTLVVAVITGPADLPG